MSEVNTENLRLRGRAFSVGWVNRGRQRPDLLSLAYLVFRDQESIDCDFVLEHPTVCPSSVYVVNFG
jgi:hypothetical protein